MQIKELAQAALTDAQTIRFYEKKGLMPAPTRLDNGYRDYQPVHLERLHFIRHCRSLDMPLADVAELLAMTAQPRATAVHAEDVVGKHLQRVQQKIASLGELQAQLLRLQQSCKAQHANDSCGVLAELVEAAKGEACACHGKRTSAAKPDGFASASHQPAPLQ